MPEVCKQLPPGLGRAGAGLWEAVVAQFELEKHEMLLLREACRTADLLDVLEDLVSAEGPLIGSSQGPRTHPAVVEIRQQRIALARLLAAMRLPVGDEDVPARRGGQVGVRGVYGVVGGGAA